MVEGTPLVSKKYLKDPNNVVRLLSDAVELFHQIKAPDCTFKNIESIGNTFIHGDFCLPNIIIKNNPIKIILIGFNITFFILSPF